MSFFKKYVTRLVLDSLSSAIEDEGEVSSYSFFDYYAKSYNKFKSSLLELIVKQATRTWQRAARLEKSDIRDIAKEKIDERLSSERFIDDLVEKINKKQLER